MSVNRCASDAVVQPRQEENMLNVVSARCVECVAMKARRAVVQAAGRMRHGGNAHKSSVSGQAEDYSCTARQQNMSVM